jgi:SAM-dependent methyltransferase
LERIVTGPMVAFDTANPEQAAAWNGHEGEHWAANADRFERIGDGIWQRALARELVGASDRVLDIGCGTGASTRDLAAIAVDGYVLGVDLSAPMLEVGRARAAAARLDNVEFVQADAQIHPFRPAAFDVAMSCFGAMFFTDPVAAFANVGQALRHHGTLALLAWREMNRNEWITEIRSALAMGRDLPVPPPEAPTPFSLADQHRVHAILDAAGYVAVEFEAVDEPMGFGTDADDAYGFIETMGIVEWLTHDLDEADRAEALARLRRTVHAHDGSDGVAFGSSAWLITAYRTADDGR